jgi:hypothetical protein
MDFKGTDKDDIIDQAKQGIADWTNIYGGAGNDVITIGNAVAIGEAGNDTIVGTTPGSGVAYWNSPSGIKANLATGRIEDGFGGVDTVSGVRTLTGSGFDDQIVGSKANETFYPSAGSNTVDGGGGADTVKYFDARSTSAQVSYDAATDTFTVKKSFADGDHGTDVLKGVQAISFTGPNADNVTLTRDQFVPVNGFQRGTAHIVAGFGDPTASVDQVAAGDFNGDGKVDVALAYTRPDPNIPPVPLQIFVGDGKGGFTDQSATIFEGGIQYVHFPRLVVADFNNDGISDIFNLDFGLHVAPWPGGLNSLFVSSPATHKLVNLSSTLTQEARQHHAASVGDLDGNGSLDIVVNAINDGMGKNVVLQMNDGAGHFASSVSTLPASITKPVFSPGYSWSVVADVDNDGHNDVVLGSIDGVEAAPSVVLLNDGHGAFAGQPIVLPTAPVPDASTLDIEQIDLNGDDLPDLVVAVTNQGNRDSFYQIGYVQLLINDGGGHFHDETQARFAQTVKTPVPGAGLGYYYSAVIPVDLNRDGFQDLVLNGDGGPSRIMINDGTGKFSLTWEQDGFIEVADVNGDGMADLLQSSAANGTVDVLFNKMGSGHVYKVDFDNTPLRGSSGNDTLLGRGGQDTVRYDGQRANFTVTHTATGFTVSDKSGGQGTDTLSAIERLSFADGAVALDIDGTAGMAYRVYQAAFNRTPDKGGLGFWIGAMDKGSSLLAVAQGFVNSQEFKDLYGIAPGNHEIVAKFYENVLRRPGEAAGIDFWTGVLDNHAASVTEVLMGFSESAENKAALVGVTANGIDYTPFW